MSEPIAFLYHIPKTGGTTVRAPLLEALGDRAEWLQNWNPERGRRPKDPHRSAAEFEQAVRDGSSTEHLRLLLGHEVRRDLAEHFPSRRLQEIAFVREPGAFVRSRYLHRVRIQGLDAGMSFEEFSSERSPDQQTRDLASKLFPGQRPSRSICEQVLEAANSFAFIATTESIDDVYPQLLDVLGVPFDGRPLERRNTRAQHVAAGRDEEVELPNAPMDIYRERSAFDAALHEIARRGTAEALGGFTTAHRDAPVPVVPRPNG